jgi:DNA modification methylase
VGVEVSPRDTHAPVGRSVVSRAGVARSATDRPLLSTSRADLWHGDSLEVYPLLEEGLVELVICDGPYGLQIGDEEWDRVDDLVALYEPHVAAWDRVCAPGASVYLWGSEQAWATLHPLMLRHGWRFQSLITWDKGSAPSQKCERAMARNWPVATEVAGFYQRDPWHETAATGPATFVGHAAGRDERNWIRGWLVEEWDATGLRRGDADRAMGTNGMSGHYFGRSQWELPTWERYVQLATYAAGHGAPRDRPYLVHPDAIGLRASWDHLRASWDHLRAEWDHLRAEYEAQRAPFDLPAGVTNVWRHPQVRGRWRLRDEDGSALHPCQKPVALYRRMIEASTRPGGVVLEPFGGTCRAAVATTLLGSRRAICIERDRRYLDAVRPSLELVVEDRGPQLALRLPGVKEGVGEAGPGRVVSDLEVAQSDHPGEAVRGPVDLTSSRPPSDARRGPTLDPGGGVDVDPVESFLLPLQVEDLVPVVVPVDADGSALDKRLVAPSVESEDPGAPVLTGDEDRGPSDAHGLPEVVGTGVGRGGPFFDPPGSTGRPSVGASDHVVEHVGDPLGGADPVEVQVVGATVEDNTSEGLDPIEDFRSGHGGTSA